MKETTPEAHERRWLEEELRNTKALIERYTESKRRAKTPELRQVFNDKLFELRCRAKWLEEAVKMAGKQWKCVDCGAIYGPEWVAYYGARCHMDCDGWLEEVGAHNRS